MAVYQAREYPLNQGDLFGEVPLLSVDGSKRPDKVARAMVVSHDCDCDKYFSEIERGRAREPDLWPVTVAPVYELSDLRGGQGGDARAGRIKRFFYIAPEGDHGEMVADLWFEQPVSITQLLALPKIASLSDEWLKRLHIQIWELRTRRLLPALEPAEVADET